MDFKIKTEPVYLEQGLPKNAFVSIPNFLHTTSFLMPLKQMDYDDSSYDHNKIKTEYFKDSDIKKTNLKEMDGSLLIKNEVDTYEYSIIEDKRKQTEMNFIIKDEIDIEYEECYNPKPLIEKFDYNDFSIDEINDVYEIKNEIDEEVINDSDQSKSKYNSTLNETQLSKKLDCKYCNKSFSTKYVLEQHINGMHFQKFKCEICQASFSTKVILNGHINRIHLKVEDASLQCKICKKTFAIKSYLHEHMKEIHIRQKDEMFNCKLCEKTFTRRYYLKEHINFIHLRNDKDLRKCEFCEKTYSSNSNLKKHMNNFHLKTTKDQTFKCEICEKQFTNISNLRLHIKGIHLKMFNCNICGNTFSKKSLLKQHKDKIHAVVQDEKPQQGSDLKIE